jgi:hypothetical protein
MPDLTPYADDPDTWAHTCNTIVQGRLADPDGYVPRCVLDLIAEAVRAGANPARLCWQIVDRPDPVHTPLILVREMTNTVEARP